jgi:hypothetical protein
VAAPRHAFVTGGILLVLGLAGCGGSSLGSDERLAKADALAILKDSGDRSGRVVKAVQGRSVDVAGASCEQGPKLLRAHRRGSVRAARLRRMCRGVGLLTRDRQRAQIGRRRRLQTRSGRLTLGGLTPVERLGRRLVVAALDALLVCLRFDVDRHILPLKVFAPSWAGLQGDFTASRVPRSRVVPLVRKGRAPVDGPPALRATARGSCSADPWSSEGGRPGR